MKTPKTNGTDFTTADLHVAAYLLAMDHPLLRLDGSPGQRSFVFGNVAQEEVAGFYAGAKVDGRKILGALRDLKGLLNEGRRR